MKKQITLTLLSDTSTLTFLVILSSIICISCIGCKNNDTDANPDASFVVEEYLNGKYYESQYVAHSGKGRARALVQNDKYKWGFKEVMLNNASLNQISFDGSLFNLHDSLTFQLQTSNKQGKTDDRQTVIYPSKSIYTTPYLGSFKCHDQGNIADTFSINISRISQDSIVVTNLPKGLVQRHKVDLTAYAGGSNLVLDYFDTVSGIVYDSHIYVKNGLITIEYTKTSQTVESKIFKGEKI